jgi:hypothetical protein
MSNASGSNEYKIGVAEGDLERRLVDGDADRVRRLVERDLERRLAEGDADRVRLPPYVIL